MKRIFMLLCLFWLSGLLEAQSLFLSLDFKQARTYLSENLNRNFECDAREQPLTEELKQSIQESAGPVVPDTLHFFHLDVGDEKYVAIFGQAPSKHAQFDFLVILNEKTGAVYKVDVTVYRENHGNQIDYDRFKKQFVGKRNPADFRFKRKIRSITGATISARSMTLAVKKTVQVFTILKRAGVFHD